MTARFRVSVIVPHAVRHAADDLSVITSAVAGLGLSPVHPAPGPAMMSMHLVLRR